MARRYGSRHRTNTPRQPSAGAKITVSARMTDEVHVKATTIAEGLGISLSALLAELVERAEVDDHGHVAWESKYAPPADEGQEQLEMSA